MVRRLFPDPLVPILLGVVLLAAFVPVRPAWTGIAQMISTAGIVALFFLNGVKLSRTDVWAGLTHWRLQGGIVAFCFLAMPCLGWIAARLFAPWVPAEVAVGLLFIGILPSTVQSATMASAMAGGNVAGSVIAAALINLLGVIVSPILFAVLASTKGVAVTADAAVRIVLILLLPFAIGQLVQRWVRPWVMQRRSLITTVDRSVIALAVYVACSSAVIGGLWQHLDFGTVAALAVAVTLMLSAAFAGAWAWGGWLRLARADRISLLFSGAQKSIAVGAPLAAILFPPEVAGVVLTPILAYHLMQLILSAWLTKPLRGPPVIVE